MRAHIARILARELVSGQQDNVLRALPLSNARKISKDLACRAERIQESVDMILRRDSVSDKPISPSKAQQYISERFRLAMELDEFYKDARKEVASPMIGVLDRKLCKRVSRDMAALKLIIANERVTHAANRAKLHLCMFSYGKHFLGEAYMCLIVEALPPPSGSRRPLQQRGARSKFEQSTFKSMVRAAYHPVESEPLMSWCPVAGSREEETLVAAHIVPQAFGELNASFLFGTFEFGKGHEKLWDIGNGMLLSSSVEKAMDAARVVFVPCSEGDEGEIKMLILDKDLKAQYIRPGFSFEQADGKPLHFKTAARPDLLSLYIHALISVARRKVYAVDNWQYDVSKVFSGRIWSGIDEEKIRKSSVFAMAAEVGDLPKNHENSACIEFERRGTR